MTVYGIISIALEAGIKIFFAVLYVSVGPSLHVVINQPFFLLLSLIATQHWRVLYTTELPPSEWLHIYDVVKHFNIDILMDILLKSKYVSNIL